MTNDESRKVAVITGAGKGLGQAYAVRLAQDGCDIAICDLGEMSETVRLVEAEGRRAVAEKCDVTNETEVNNFAARVKSEFGRADILINNAGIYPFVAFDAMTFADWRKVLSIDLDAPFLVTKAFVPLMKTNNYGRIVNISSAACWMVAPQSTHYQAAKMGVVGLTRGLASEYGESGITVNAVAPGLTHTPGTDKGQAGELGFFDMMPQLQSIKRGGETRDLIPAISFLASEESRFITGQTIVVDGGAVRL